MTDALSAPLQLSAELGRNFRDLRKNPVKHFLKKSELNSYSSIKVPLPPRQEQIKIVEALNRSMRSVAKLLEKAVMGIELLRERRSALISAAVTGKIDVRDWEPPVSETFPHSTASEEAPA